MRKLQITAIGEPAGVLELVEFQAPAPGPGQVLVEVRAVTINTSDFLYIRGVGDRRVPEPVCRRRHGRNLMIRDRGSGSSPRG